MPEWVALVQDDDCHWYLIPAGRRGEWNDWRDAFDPEDVDTHEPPPWAEPVEGPHVLEFREYRDSHPRGSADET